MAHYHIPAYKFSVIGLDAWHDSMSNIISSCDMAQRATGRPRDDGCHYCGNPEPGDKCRYCGVTPRQQMHAIRRYHDALIGADVVVVRSC